MSISGEPDRGYERHGTIALLELPLGTVQEYPALMVRCLKHGDAILARTEVLSALRSRRRQLRAEVSFPLTAYDVGEPPADGHAANRVVNSSVTRRFSVHERT